MQVEFWAVQGQWALPGGFVDENEPLDRAASRELQEETSVNPSDVLLTQVRLPRKQYFQPLAHAPVLHAHGMQSHISSSGHVESDLIHSRISWPAWMSCFNAKDVMLQNEYQT